GQELAAGGREDVPALPELRRLRRADADVPLVLGPGEAGDAVVGEGLPARFVVVRLAVHERSVEIEDDREGAELAHAPSMAKVISVPCGRSTRPAAAAAAGHVRAG